MDEGGSFRVSILCLSGFNLICLSIVRYTLKLVPPCRVNMRLDVFMTRELLKGEGMQVM